MKHMLAIFISAILLFSFSIGFAEENLALPDELINAVSQGEDINSLYQLFLSSFESTEYSRSEIYEEAKRFSMLDFCLNRIQYKNISVDLNLCLISLELQRPLGEKIEDCQVFINTVNFYDKKYKNVGRDETSRLIDETLGSISSIWEDKKSGIRIKIMYFNGDVSKLVYPRIEIGISGKISRDH